MRSRFVDCRSEAQSLGGRLLTFSRLSVHGPAQRNNLDDSEDLHRDRVGRRMTEVLQGNPFAKDSPVGGRTLLDQDEDGATLA